ncbi:hypothetical protein BBF93_06740 [Hyphomonas sp. CACIAM 19H1]|uniref:RHS repeat-associated core domain-containing protein n=1 Tax=Hyphomonas sp. CACIAM 19H1 TaxID=1873716 RepID=UPI000DED7BF6|nr:RHS repeat-associated core domain-containing protein [Hyphomonas sp. CACIAM 19H1]AXE63948.1 hypothetical protein BBF93_06740 [Hyphomonas sp. CACIAM 19H1]
MTLAHDPGGCLRQTVSGGNTTQFLYGGNALLAEYDGAGTLLRRYVHGPGIDEPLVWYEGAGLTDRRYLIADRQGSIVAVTWATSSRQLYGPYGEPDIWAGSRLRYTGQIALPEVSLYHYKARAYDPVLGRFLQTDPVGYADGLNWYAYVGNDPLNFMDPSGAERVHAKAFIRSTYGRSRAYQSFNASLQDGTAKHPTYFFAAASYTTGLTGLGGGEIGKMIPGARWLNPMSGKSVTYANHLGVLLYAQVNKPLYEPLYDGGTLPSELQGLSGTALDHALVSLEQSLVQSYLESMPDKDRAQFSNKANRALKMSPNSAVQAVLKELGGDFDFGNQAHREAIGKALTDEARNEGCVVPTGSKICR